MPTVSLRRSPRPRRFVVCGDNPLAYRLVNELVTRFGAEVTVVLPRRDRNQGPLLGQLPGVRLVEAAQPDDAALRAAGVPDARALALVNQDDVGNIHAALRAHDLNPDLRMVIRMFNTSLGFRIRTLFQDCAVLSDSAMAAPSFVAAALGEVAPSHVRLPGRTLYVARSADVPDSRVVCGLADTSGAIDKPVKNILAVTTTMSIAVGHTIHERRLPSATRARHRDRRRQRRDCCDNPGQGC